MINNKKEKKKTLSGQSKRHNMKCSFNLHWLLAAWGEGTGFVLRRLRELGGTGLTGEKVGRVEGARGSKVLQVTVQVERQILSAVWRKALEVPTVQRERSSYVWNTSSGSFKGKLVEWSDRMATLLHQWAKQQAGAGKTERECPPDKTKRNSKRNQGHVRCHFQSFPLSVFKWLNSSPETTFARKCRRGSLWSPFLGFSRMKAVLQSWCQEN